MKQKEETAQSTVSKPKISSDSSSKAEVNEDVSKLFIAGFDKLTPKESELFHAYIAGTSTKDIMVAMDITENTLKYHSRNLYGKLGVTSRKQMVAVYRYLHASGITLD